MQQEPTTHAMTIRSQPSLDAVTEGAEGIDDDFEEQGLRHMAWWGTLPWCSILCIIASSMSQVPLVTVFLSAAEV